MSTAVDVSHDAPAEEDQAPGQEVEVRTSLIPAPTLPASMAPATTTQVPEMFGGGCMGMANAYGGSRAESEQNKKPYALIKLGHKLCGFVR